MNKEDFVSLECAKILKEKGYDWDCLSVFHYNNDEYQFIENYSKTFCTDRPRNFNNENVYGLYTWSAPTLYEAQEWLREHHNTHIAVDVYKGNLWAYEVWNVDSGKYRITRRECTEFPTYESALNAGIIDALNLI